MIVVPGPAPNPNARRRNARPDWVELPVEGRSGRAPAWPLSGRAPAGWAELWRLPQAVMWERQKCVELVARYLLARRAAFDSLLSDEPNASLVKALTELEDRLGLSPMALKRLQWIVPEEASVVPEGRVINARDRFSKL